MYGDKVYTKFCDLNVMIHYLVMKTNIIYKYILTSVFIEL